jgi:predicted TPR repeat methyltransferase
MPRKAKKSSRKQAQRPKRDGTKDITLTIDNAVEFGIRLLQQGDVAAAAEIYRQVLSGRPDHVDALHFLGVSEHQLGRSEVALELLGRAVDLAPEHPDVHNNLGNVLRQLGRLEDAEKEYKKALELRPQDANALNNLATILRERGQLEEAVGLYHEVIALEPEHYEAHENLGRALRSLNRLDEALAAHEKALRLRPRHGGAYRELGAVYYALGRIEESAAIYRLWLGVDPGHPVAQHMLAACSGEDVPVRASDDFVRESFDVFASHFDKTLAGLGYRAPELVGEAVERALGSGQGTLAVLDVGCGTGLCAPLLRPHAARLVGVDLSQKMLNRAEERRLYDELVAAELTAYLAEHPAAYDLVVSADTLVYFGGLEDVAAGASSSIRPGGHLIFTVERSEPEEAPDGYRIHPHGRYSHTEPYLQRVLGEAGFEVTDLRPVELRLEAKIPVRGSLVTAKKTKPAATPD